MIIDLSHCIEQLSPHESYRLRRAFCCCWVALFIVTLENGYRELFSWNMCFVY